MAQIEVGQLRVREATVDLQPIITDLITLVRDTASPGVELVATAIDLDHRYVRGDDDRIRLFGVNLCFGGNFPAEADAARIAQRLAEVDLGPAIGGEVLDEQRARPVAQVALDLGVAAEALGLLADVDHRLLGQRRQEGHNEADDDQDTAVEAQVVAVLEEIVGRGAEQGRHGQDLERRAEQREHAGQFAHAGRVRHQQQPVIGPVLMADEVDGLKVIRPPHFDLANAVGAAIAQISGEVSRIVPVSAGLTREEAIEQVQKEIFDLVITDLRMPKVDGMEVLRAVKSASPETVVLIITAFATADSAVEAMKQGAYDYLTKPFQVDEVQLIIRNALEKRRLTTENILLKREMASQSSFAQLVGQSEAMQKVFDVVKKVADSKSNVLICGESGTGKELVARAIHYNSARSALPFVAVNCSAVPETLLESELFGHEKGSFTGAYRDKPGKFEAADGVFGDAVADGGGADDQRTIGYGFGDTTYVRALPRIGLQRLSPTVTALLVP